MSKTKFEPTEAPPVAKSPDPKEPHPDFVAAHMPSPNEPLGSDLDGETAPPVEPPPPLVLTSIDPDALPVQPGNVLDVTLDVIGSGFTPDCVVLFDDEEVPTAFTSDTRIEATVPVSQGAGVYDVEVQRGEDLSDVLVFEIVLVTGTRSGAPARKAKKSEPAHKRPKKGRR